MTMIFEQHRLAAAEHIARKAVRLQRQGDADAFHRAQNRLCDVVEASRWPNVMIGNLIQSIGRVNSIAVLLDRKIVDFHLGR